MKLNQETTPVEIDGAIGKPTTFSIAASKQAFKILSSGLYNNKIRAIIRELSCNAYDAHVAADKKAVPFELNLPNELTPEFRIKDYGTGLEYIDKGCKNCHGKGKLLAKNEVGDGVLIEEEVTCPKCGGTGDYDAVKELYCTYFASNKSDSNLFVGALGLGSKSPFCYTEGFTVTNRYNGTTRIYACFINGQGLPDVLLQSKEDTPGVENGLEVSFPVRSEHFWEFENQAKDALEFFDPLPILNCDLNVRKQAYIFKNEKWGLRKDSNIRGLRAIQGMVQYQVGNIDMSRLSYKQRKLSELGLDLFFDIGQLSVAASRESLSNDETTINNIITALDAVTERLVEDVKEQVKIAKTPWEAKLMIFSLVNQAGIGGIVNEAYERGDFDKIYTGFELHHGDPFVNQLNYPKIAAYKFQSSWRQGLQAEKNIVSLTEDSIEKKKAYAKANNETLEEVKMYFKVSGDCIFIINDVGFGGEKYVHYFLKEAPDNRGDKKKGIAYFITRDSKDIPVDYIVRQAEKMIVELGNPPSIKLSELKGRYQIQAAKDPTPYVKRELFIFNIDGYFPHVKQGYRVQGWQQAWNKVDDHKNEAVRLFCPLDRLEPAIGNFEHAEAFQDFCKDVIGAGVFGLSASTEIYGIPKDSKFKNDPGWVEFFTYVMEKLKKFMTPEEELKLSLVVTPFDSHLNDILEEIATKLPLSGSSLIQEFSKKLHKAKKYNTTKTSALQGVIRKAESLNLYKANNIINFQKEWDKIIEHYPLLRYVENYYYGDKIQRKQEFIDYFRMVDERQAKLNLLQIMPAAIQSSNPIIN